MQFAAISGAIAVILGALGAHALKGKLTPELLSSFETGVKYQMYHSILLALLFILLEKHHLPFLKKAGYCFIAGICMFSGSIYLLSTRSLSGLENISFLGPVTPLGGLTLIAGWLLMFVAFTKKT